MQRSQKFFRIMKSRTTAIIAVFFFALTPLILHQANPSGSLGASKRVSLLRPRARVIENFGRLPLSFEPNRGQASPKVQFVTRGRGFEALLDKSGATLLIGGAPQMAMPIGHHPAPSVAPEKPARIRMNLVGASLTSRPE